ncbi:hypothetical protein C8R47DRAFT_233830 [Mycena vitilis]|nr:hypothetical protein C8R47DRAFT_233830 [Mycena vitilis]
MDVELSHNGLGGLSPLFDGGRHSACRISTFVVFACPFHMDQIISTIALTMKFSTALVFTAVALAPSALAQTESFPTVNPTLGPPSRSLSFPLSVVSSSLALPSLSLSSIPSVSASVTPSGSASSSVSTPTAPSGSDSLSTSGGSVTASGSVTGSAPSASASAPNAAGTMAAGGLVATVAAGLLAAMLV